jgi:ubiquinone/menaquinone biosynthesis C-methylase UbiE
LVAVNIMNGVTSGRLWPFVAAVLVLACAGCGLYTSKRGKFLVWRELLDELALDGHEQVLDLGCGRGAVLLLAAQHLTSGRAVGVDLWRRQDQSGNTPAAARRNVAAEGVAGHAELCTANIRLLPFASGRFDFVLSSAAIHNIMSRTDRDRTIDEAVRVLRPGGRLLIADLRGTKRYQARLTELGMTNVTRSNLGWRMWWSGPWLPTHLVTATKPSV